MRPKWDGFSGVSADIKVGQKSDDIMSAKIAENQLDFIPDAELCLWFPDIYELRYVGLMWPDFSSAVRCQGLASTITYTVSNAEKT